MRRQVHVGISAHQKLDKLLEVVKILGFQSLCIFGDCFDEVTLLDPVTYPGAIKQFAKEARARWQHCLTWVAAARCAAPRVRSASRAPELHQPFAVAALRCATCIVGPRSRRCCVQVCRNDLLTFGRMHFFFPDSRVNLDLTTDKTLKDARFDRHFVREMVWSRHQLEELAERRFQAAQDRFGVASLEGSPSGSGNGSDYKPGTPFSELFKEVSMPAAA